MQDLMSHFMPDTLPHLSGGEMSTLDATIKRAVRRTQGLPDADRGDVGQCALMVGMAMVADGADPRDAGALSVKQVLRYYFRDRAVSREDVTDWDLHPDYPEEHAYSSSTISRPDAIVSTTPRDIAYDAIEVLRITDYRLFTAVCRWMDTARSSRITIKLQATLADAVREALPRIVANVLIQYAIEENRTKRTSVSADLPDRWVGVATQPADHPGGAWGRMPAPSSGMASDVIIRHRSESGPTCHACMHASCMRVRASYRDLTPTEAATLAGNPNQDAYVATPEDRDADAFAYVQTPVGGVKKSNTRKTKRTGGVGGPTITRGARLDWSVKAS